jgi:rod shape-determining protein MreB and related proteins
VAHDKHHSGEMLTVGIDLGTSRSAISSSNGEQLVVDSFVGWPTDMVARKVLKRDLLVGKEALDHRTMLDLHRPLERGLLKEGSPRDVEAARELLRHLLSRITANGNGNGKHHPVGAVVGVPATALRASKQHLRNALKGLVDNLMIVSEPFAVAYGTDALLHTMIVDIGAGTTDFCVMNGRYPTEDEQRTLLHAGDWVDDQLATYVRGQQPEAQFSVHMVREWKERWSFVGEPKGPVMVTVQVAGKPTSLDITQEMRRACEGLLAPIGEAMFDLLARVEPEYHERVRNNIILAGGGSQIPGLSEALQRLLGDVGGGKVRAVEDPVFAGSNGSLALALDAVEADWEQLPG